MVPGSCFGWSGGLPSFRSIRLQNTQRRLFETFSGCAVPVPDSDAVGLVFGSSRLCCCPGHGRSWFEEPGDRRLWQHKCPLLNFSLFGRSLSDAAESRWCRVGLVFRSNWDRSNVIPVCMKIDRVTHHQPVAALLSETEPNEHRSNVLFSRFGI